jgi:hypothetical protein
MTQTPRAAEVIRKEAELIEAGLQLQGQGLELLLAEMRALATLIPGATVHHPTEAETEASFDNMPV